MDTFNYKGLVLLQDNLDSKLAPRPSRIRLSNPFPHEAEYTLSIVCKAGSARMRIAGKDCLLQADELLLIDPDSLIDSVEFGEDFRAACVACSTRSFLNRGDSVTARMLRQRRTPPRLIPLEGNDTFTLLTVYGYMRELLEDGEGPYTEDALEGALLLMGSLAVRRMLGKEGETKRNPAKLRIVRDFLTEVKQHHTEERSVAYYAAALCLSPKYFAQVIFRETGKHAKDWIRDAVIHKAKILLDSGTMTVQEVSDTLCFPNSSFFGKYFKASTGCSPREYSKRKDGPSISSPSADP